MFGARSSLGTAALAAMLIFAQTHYALEAASEAKESPADGKQVLARFLGNWETHTKIYHLAGPVREIETRGKATCEATLGGRFFEFRTQTVPPGEADLQIMTYDAESRLFRQWVFSSDGYRHEATGTWDPATSTLRWTGKSGETTFVIDDHWVSPDQLDWTLERKNAGGKVTQTIRGTVSRSNQ